MSDHPLVPQVIAEFILGEFLPGEDPANLSDQTQLITSGILDSLATLRLIAFVEQKFGVRIAAHEADESNFDTIELISRLIESKR